MRLNALSPGEAENEDGVVKAMATGTIHRSASQGSRCPHHRRPWVKAVVLHDETPKQSRPTREDRLTLLAARRPGNLVVVVKRCELVWA